MKIQHLLTKSLLLISTLALPAPNADKLQRISNYYIQPRNNEATPPPDGKYFHEPGGGDDLGHYDIRYFNGKPVSYEERGETLYHLIRSYLSVFRERNIETWIAHGTLLGWWWNGKIMPWDWDLDTQVSGSTLAWLGQNMNMTMHNFTMSEPDGTPMFREYLLDVNPYSAERVRGDGQNVIDARWIDVRNGLFIDITGLSETNPSAQPGVWSCKNYHRYRTRDLYPLRETVYEGVPALVPYSFDRILTEEYSARALTKTKHEGHLWVPEQKEWIRQDVLQQNSDVHGRDVPHIPRSLQADEKPRAGLGNLLRIL
ncbi:related to mannosylphosphorylation protein MNN4 [Rhynchosporium agropyri]|uniref:Related to mannosylphosphorylation protein MNN4 n=1 Tax=Rhynchosporium agropyri TaxID=914238 RepID=A0A1E1LE20_9HELO|nr:related to mannosylphosphorylation protein MNN4 [Rhynchosporium agropyri]